MCRDACIFCQIGYAIKNEEHESWKIRAYLDGDNFVVDEKDKPISYKIKYCPFCGRDLREREER